MSSPTCSARGCRNRTRHHSGRCHHHRGPARIEPYIPPPVPVGGNVIRSVTAVYPNGRMRTLEYTRNGRLDRADGPAWITYHPNGDRKSEIYFRYGKVHRDGDEPAWIDYYMSGAVDRENYFRSDHLARTGGPSSIHYDENGQVVEEGFDDAELERREAGHPSRISYSALSGEITDRWYRVGREEGGRKDGGPSLVSYFQGGDVQSEQWRNTQGDLHRTDGPALVTYRKDGRVASEEWHDSGSRHRVGAPAVIRRQAGSDGPAVEEWWFEGRPHHFGGPSEVNYRADGSVAQERWAIYGSEGIPSEIESRLSVYSPDQIEMLVESSEYAPLLTEGAPAQAIFYAVLAGVTTIEGVREVTVNGAPVEWVRAFLEGRSDASVEG